MTVKAARAAAPHVPLVTTEHDSRNRRRTPLLRPLDAWMYGRYRAVVCVGEDVASNLASWLPAARDRLHVIENGIPIERALSARPLPRESLTGSREAPLLAYVARFHPKKDHATLLRAMVLLPGVHLALMGDGELRREIERLATDLHVRERVHFLGFRDDLYDVLATADIYVHPSLVEGFPIAPLEAMAVGAPIVATRVPGLEPLVDGAGLLVDPSEPEALAEAIQRLLKDDAERSRLARAARDRACAYSIERTAQRYAALYAELIAGNP